MSDIFQGIQRSTQTLQAMRELQLDAKEQALAQRIASKDALAEILSETTYHLAGKIRKKEKTLKSHKERIRKNMSLGEKMERMDQLKQNKDTASKFQKENKELNAETLLRLREQIKPGDTKEQILAKIKLYYPDATLSSEVMEFLLETTDGELHRTVLELQGEFNEENAREIAAGKNITEEARAASEKGLGTPTSLRDQYRDLTGSPRDAGTLFDESRKNMSSKTLRKWSTFSCIPWERT